MTELVEIHAKNPQLRLLKKIIDIIHRGGVVILPTDSGHSLVCGLEQKDAMQRIRQIRQLDQTHYFTLFCCDFSQVSTYASLNNSTFRFVKSLTPGAVTFILTATREVPKRLLHPKRRTIGIRIPQSLIVLALLAELGEPLMSVSVESSEHKGLPMDSEQLYAIYDGMVDAVVDSGINHVQQTTIIDLTSGVPEVVRQGK